MLEPHGDACSAGLFNLNSVMGKVRPKSKELTRRDQRRLWRDDAGIRPFRPAGTAELGVTRSTPPVVIISSRTSRRRGKKSGKRDNKKPIQIIDVLSPSKAKRIKDASIKQRTGGAISCGLQ
jgi:hypothetical protein